MKIAAENRCNSLGSSIFLSGANGVGKTALCNAVVQRKKVEHVTASSLLEKNAKSIVGGESEFICRRIEEMLTSTPFLLVDGHFALFDRRYYLVKVDQEIFRRIRVQGIVVLVDAVESIQERLEKRDGKRVDLVHLKAQQDAELEHSVVVARMLNVDRKIIDVSQGDFAERVNDVLSFIATFPDALR